MKQISKQGRLVAQLRKVIGKSQSQFAAMLGVSKDTIISVENGRNQFTLNLARKIYIATGAVLHKELHERTQVPGESYSREEFEQWRSHYYPGNSKTALQQFDRMQFWIKLLFQAAAKPGVAGNRDRLPAVHLSLVEWLEYARIEFKLESEIEDLLEEETRHVGQDRTPILQLKLTEDKFDEPYLIKLAARLCVDYPAFKKAVRKKKNSDLLVIEDEFKKAWIDMFDLWDPLNEQTWYKTPCKTRKLLSKPKYWFEKADAGGNPLT